MSYNLFALGMMSMNRKILIIGSVVASVLIGGTIVYGSQSNTVAASAVAYNNSPLVETLVATSSIAITGIASDMTSSTVTFHGVVYPHKGEISYWFEYSSDPLLGLILIRKSPRIVFIDNSKQKIVEATVSGLMKSTKYYFRIVTQDSDGTVRGERISFNTH